MADLPYNKLDPPAEERPSKAYDAFGKEYGVDYVEPPPLGALMGLRFGFRGMPQAKFPGPWAAEKPPAQGPVREWKQPGDDSELQKAWEFMWGMKRKPGQAVADPESGSVWRSPLTWLGGGGAGYAGWNAAGGPEAWEDLKNGLADDYTPGAPGWEKRQLRNARWTAEGLDRDLAASHGIIPRSTSGMSGAVLSAPLTDEQRAAIDRVRGLGGVGNAPY